MTATRGYPQLFELAERTRAQLRDALPGHGEQISLITIEPPAFHALTMAYKPQLHTSTEDFTRNYEQDWWEFGGVKCIQGPIGSGIRLYRLCCQA